MNDLTHPTHFTSHPLAQTHDNLNLSTALDISEESLPDTPPQHKKTPETDEIQDATEHFEGMTSLPDQNSAASSFRITTQCIIKYLCKTLLTILRGIKAFCVFSCQNQCQVIIALQLLLLFLRVINVLDGSVAGRLSFGLLLVGLVLGCFGCYDSDGERRPRRRRVPRQINMNRIDSNDIIRNMVLQHIRQIQIRDTIDILNQQRNNGIDLEDPAARVEQNRRIRFRFANPEFPDLQILNNLLVQALLVQNAPQQSESQGLSKETIESLMPIVRYEMPEGVEVGGFDEEGKNSHCCTICLDEFLPEQEVRVSPCEHTFHIACIDSWLSIRNNCPNCKQEIGQVESNPVPHFAGLFLPSFGAQMQNNLRVEANLSQPRAIPEGDLGSFNSIPSDVESD